MAKSDQTMTLGLGPVVEKCEAKGVLPANVFEVNAQMIGIFYTEDVYKMGVSSQDFSAEFERRITWLLQNQGSNPLGCCRNIK